MKRVYISVINDLVTDQRVLRVASSIEARGGEVTLIGRRLKSSPPIHYIRFKCRRFRMFFIRGPLFYASYNIRLFFYLMLKKRPDLLISNDLDTLPANYLVSKFRKIELLYDSHEYFTEVPELAHRKRIKRIWTRIERAILPKVKHAMTVSPSIAKAYQIKYGTNFSVVRNVPVWREPELDGEIKKRYNNRQIIIYQGSLNLGRGLELLIKAMGYVEDAVLLIAGEGDISAKLRWMVKDSHLEDRVHFLGRILPEELYPITCSADMGISLEEDFGLNYRYALPNKLFSYIQARIPVLCSDLPEMKAIVETYDVGVTISDRDPEVVAVMLILMLKDRKRGKWKESLEVAAQALCWENEEKVLGAVLEVVNV